MQTVTIICRSDNTFRWTRDFSMYAPLLAQAGAKIRLFMKWDNDGSTYTWLSAAAPNMANANFAFDMTSAVGTFIAPMVDVSGKQDRAVFAMRIELADGTSQTVWAGDARWFGSDLPANIPGAAAGVGGMSDTVFVVGEQNIQYLPLPLELAGAVSAARAAQAAAEAVVAMAGSSADAAAQDAGDAHTDRLAVDQALSDTQAARDLAQKWATLVSDEVVPGQGYSAKKYASDAAVAAQAASDAAGLSGAARDLAQQWATQTGSEVSPGQGYGAKKYAGDANASASGAAASKTGADNSAGAAVQALANTQNLLNSVSALALLTQGYMTSTAAIANSATALATSNLSSAARMVLGATDVVGQCSISPMFDAQGPAVVGPWSDKCAAASWQAFGRWPVLAVAVLRSNANTLSVISRADPTGPVWATWTVAGVAAGAVRYANGALRYAGAGGLYTIDFVLDRVTKRDTTGHWVANQNVAAFNQSTATWSLLDSSTIGSATINWLDVFVPPLSAPDPNRAGLARTMVAAGTASGVSVVRWDGSVSSSASTTSYGLGCFDSYGNLWAGATTASMNVAPLTLIQTPSWSVSALATFNYLTFGVSNLARIVAAGPGMVAIQGGGGVARIKIDMSAVANSLISVKTAAFDSGWMVIGKTIFALAEFSGDSAVLNGATPLNDDFTGGNPGGWVAGTNTTINFTGGQMQISNAVDGYFSASKPFATVAGGVYEIRFSETNVTGNPGCSIQAGTTSQGHDLVSVIPASMASNGSSYSGLGVSFRAVGAMTYVTVSIYRAAPTNVIGIGFVSIKLVTLDRSTNNSNLVVNGSLTRNAVASGADCGAISGFSTANYLERAYDPAFDPGTGDLYVKAGVSLAAALSSTKTFVDRANPAGAGAYYRLDTDPSGKPRFTISDGTNSASVVGPIAVPAGPHRLRGIRRGTASRIEIELDGVVVATASAAAVGSLNNASAVLRVGLSAAGANPMDAAGPGIMLAQVGLCAPSLDQVAFMWLEALPRFQPNAKEVLTGAAVQGVAYDPETDQIAVSNATNGVDICKGHVRSANDNSTAAANRVSDSNFTGLKVGDTVVATYQGIAMTVAGAGYINGSRYVDVLIAGTATAAGAQTWWMGLLGGSAASAGQTWSGGLATQLVAGSAANILTPNYQVEGWTSANGYVEGTTGALALGGALTRTSVSRTMVGGTVARAASRFYFQWSAGAAINATIRFYQPNLALAASDVYSDGLSNSGSAKSLAFAGGDLSVATANGVDFFLGAAPGVRELAKVKRAAAPYDPTRGVIPGVITANATPTDSLIGLCREGYKIDFVIEHSCEATGFATYGGWTTKGTVKRAIGGSAVVDATTTRNYPGSTTMAISVSANAAADGLKAVETGVAATSLTWRHEVTSWREAPYGQAA